VAAEEDPGVFNDFYASLAQVLPVLLLGLMWDSTYLARLRDQHRRHRRVAPDGVWFWTKPRVRAYTISVSIIIVLTTAASLLVLAGLIPDSYALRVGVSAGTAVALGTLLFRIGADIVVATRPNTIEPYRDDPPDLEGDNDAVPGAEISPDDGA
jgi:hypothetical protein